MEYEAEIMEVAARGLYYETARALGMPDDALRYDQTVIWVHGGSLYVMTSEKEYVGLYTRPDIVAAVMAEDSTEVISPPVYRVIPVADIDGVRQEDGSTRLFFHVGKTPRSSLFLGLEAYDYLTRHVLAPEQPG